MVSYTFLSLSGLVLAAISLSAPIENANYGTPGDRMVSRDDAAPSTQALLNDCPGGPVGNADKCTFEESGTETVYQYQLSTGANNCQGSTDPITATAAVTDSVTNSWTVGGGAGVGADGGPEVPIGVTAKISVTYGKGSTEAHSFSVSVPADPNSQSYYIQQKELTRHNGRIRVNYGSTVGGHYIWYVNDSKNDVETGNVVKDLFTRDCSTNMQDIVNQWNADAKTKHI